MTKEERTESQELAGVEAKHCIDQPTIFTTYYMLLIA